MQSVSIPLGYLLLACTLWAGLVPAALAEDAASCDLSSMSIEDLSLLMRRSSPTPELIERLNGCSSKSYFALVMASRFAEREEVLNVASFSVQLGVMNRTILSALGRYFWQEACVDAVVERIQLVGVHTYQLNIDLRGILFGSVTLTRENSPVRVTLMSTGSPAERMHLKCGARVAICLDSASESGFTAWAKYAWPLTGREGAVFDRLAPLLSRDPVALLSWMRSNDSTVRWLATAQVLMSCRNLEGEFWRQLAWPGGLSRKPLVEMRPAVIAAFAPIHSRLWWDAECRAFVMPPSPEEAGK